jgi:hypothetical protein
MHINRRKANSYIIKRPVMSLFSQFRRENIHVRSLHKMYLKCTHNVEAVSVCVFHLWKHSTVFGYLML